MEQAHNTKKTRVLIITYYWPPSGGAGVQRWVKLSKYLCQQGLEAHVLTVDEAHASYMQLDPSLGKDVAPEVQVYTTRSFEPLNYYAKLVGKDKTPTAGFSNVDSQKLSIRLLGFVRSHLFIPDPRKGWNRFAYKKALEIIEQQHIQVVITTSPPHSTQLLGLRLQQKLGIPWLADLRDPWTDIYYYDLLGHSKFSKRIDQRIEKKIMLRADRMLTVSQPLKDMFTAKDTGIRPEKIHVIPNGFDPADFHNLQKARSSVFTVCYTGTMSDVYKPAVFFQCLEQVAEAFPQQPVAVQMVGKVTDALKEEIQQRELSVEFVPTVPHSEINQFQLNADLLLLAIPDIENAEGVLTGKLFEYLATGNPLIGIGPPHGEAAAIVAQCEAGSFFARDNEEGIREYLTQRVTQFINQDKPVTNWEAINTYSRQHQAGVVSEIVKELSATASKG